MNDEIYTLEINGESWCVQNGIIEATHLGNYERGAFTAGLIVKFDGAGQGFGDYVLDEWDKAAETRIGTAWGMEFLRRVLGTLDIGRWEDLKGTPVRVAREDRRGFICGIGHFYKDRWFFPKADLVAFERTPAQREEEEGR